MTITPTTAAHWDSAWALTEARHRINQERIACIPRDQAGRITLYATFLRWSK